MKEEEAIALVNRSLDSHIIRFPGSQLCEPADSVNGLGKDVSMFHDLKADGCVLLINLSLTLMGSNMFSV